MNRIVPPPPPPPALRSLQDRLARSTLAEESRVHQPASFASWFAAARERSGLRVDRMELDGLRNWYRDPRTGALRHRSGGFFTIDGLDVRFPSGPVSQWQQPIIHQPEIGVLGLLAKEFDGVLHFLMQAKVEPGNRNHLQLSPTVQATRSNYLRLHKGRAVPYLRYFQERTRHHVIADVLQSEQGAWFFRKRNRNIVLEVTEDVGVEEDFRWLTLGEIYRLLAVEDIVNMDTRTTLSCLAPAGGGVDGVPDTGDGFRKALVRSCAGEPGGVHGMAELLSWITEHRAHTDLATRPVPLGELRDWHSSPERISHDSGRFFSVIGVAVSAGTREVGGWSQPMIEPHGTGVIAMLVKEIDGVLHVLMRASAEPGYVDGVELSPTVQCVPESYEVLPGAARPRFLGDVLSAPPERIRFTCLLSEEGGRFHHALNRYLVVEADGEAGLLEDRDHRWLTLNQLNALLRHSHYLNVQARSLVACLHSMLAPRPR
ncbi:NDP-hexose 2,3-dehydratase family protein [Streptomyces halobius]|uniref:NDP-hexose 2,3-dehydratase family protein n=1 Tax=Streptomyces halobius TaxID=2879846 RepID=A0ABY4MLQ2_9ACTN|nr:NDP-hexose 2,3-dehydratase family protein [Streptomyces halobius]UQA97360.1 NDP-hexose 2,3-dehydratase family protein [Streptomyces halobius]